jgi:hypothetical protein
MRHGADIERYLRRNGVNRREADELAAPRGAISCAC